MTLSTRCNNGVTIIDVCGHIDIANSPSLRKALLASMKNSDLLAVNMATVTYIDSSGIASLLEILKESKANHKKLVLFGLTDGVREVLQLTRLTGVFEIYQSEQEAIDSGTPSRPHANSVL